MKANEIIARQDRVVYILLVVVGALGLAWTIWRHQTTAAAEALATPTTTVEQPASGGSGR